MKKKMNKLKNRMKTNKKFTIFLFVLLLVGISLGSFFITILSTTDKNMIHEYLQSYMNMIETGKMNYISTLMNSFINGAIIIIAVWLLGISIVGIPVILFLFFCKAFTLGFSIGSLFLVYHWKGALMSLVYIFPHQIIYLFSLSILTIYALSVSIKMIDAVFKKKVIDFKIIMGKYSVILGITFCLLLFSTLFETFAMPHLLKWLLSMIK